MPSRKAQQCSSPSWKDGLWAGGAEGGVMTAHGAVPLPEGIPGSTPRPRPAPAPPPASRGPPGRSRRPGEFGGWAGCGHPSAAPWPHTVTRAWREGQAAAAACSAAARPTTATGVDCAHDGRAGHGRPRPPTTPRRRSANRARRRGGGPGLGATGITGSGGRRTTSAAARWTRAAQRLRRGATLAPGRCGGHATPWPRWAVSPWPRPHQWSRRRPPDAIAFV